MAELNREVEEDLGPAQKQIWFSCFRHDTRPRQEEWYCFTLPPALRFFDDGVDGSLNHGDFNCVPMQSLRHVSTQFKVEDYFACTPVAIGSTIYALTYGERLISFHVADTEWKDVSSPSPLLISSGYSKLVTAGGFLFLIGVNFSSPKDDSVGIVFDPNTCSWDTLPDPPVGKFPCPVAVISLGHEILFAYRLWLKDRTKDNLQQSVYNPVVKEWRDLEDIDFFLYTTGMFPNSVTRNEAGTLFWVDDQGYFCCYDPITATFNRGLIEGAKIEQILESLICPAQFVPFIHVGGDLFCMLVDIYDEDSNVSKLHCLVARAFGLENPSRFLCLVVIECFLCDLPGLSSPLTAVLCCESQEGPR